MNIECKILDPRIGNEFSFPSRKTDAAAGIDLQACIESPVNLRPGERSLIETGIAVNMPEEDLVGVVASRSGLSLKHGVRVAQGIGVIDADYQGEIKVILANDSDTPYSIQPGERIAQLLFQRVIHVNLMETESFTSTSARGSGGFGSTGK